MIPTDSKLPRNKNVASYREVIPGTQLPANTGSKVAGDWMEKLRRYEKIEEIRSDLENDARSRSRTSLRSGSGDKNPKVYNDYVIPKVYYKGTNNQKLKEKKVYNYKGNF